MHQVQVECDEHRLQPALQPFRQPRVAGVIEAAANTVTAWLVTTIAGIPSASAASQ